MSSPCRPHPESSRRGFARGLGRWRSRARPSGLALVTGVLFVGFAFGAAVGSAQALVDADSRLAPQVDVLAYRFGLELFDDRDEFRGETEIELRWRQSGASSFNLDLVSRDVSGTGMVVEEAFRRSVGGSLRALEFDHRSDRLTLSLDSPSERGALDRFVVRYRGVPREGLIIGANKHGDRTFFGDNWPQRARHWLPTVDHPSDKALCSFAVTAPSHYQVVACGALAEQTDLVGDRRLTVWRSAAPMATKVMVMAAARFAVQRLGRVEGVELESWVFPQERNAGFFDFRNAESVLRFFVQRIGPYPYAKLANVQSRTRYGGTENASNIFYNENSLRGDGSNEGLVAHEIAHQWFGDSVTESDWAHLWLSEGFATYLTQLYFEHSRGREAFEQGMREARQKVLDFSNDRPRVAIVASDVGDPADRLSPITYEKGAWVLHMLRRRIGDQAFWSGLREYYRRFRNGNASSEDFAQVMQEQSGSDLTDFFAQWLDQPGQPVIEGNWRYHQESKELEVELRQVQAGASFQVAIEIAVELSVDLAGDSRVDSSAEPLDLGKPRVLLQLDSIRLENRQASTARYALDREPTSVVLDPDAWLLAELRPLRRLTD